MGSTSVSKRSLGSRLSGFASAIVDGPAVWLTDFVDRAEEIWADDLFLSDDEDDLLIAR